jgi:hypothetical protein
VSDLLRKELKKNYEFLEGLRTTLSNHSEDYLVDVKHDITEMMLSIDALLTEQTLVPVTFPEE